MESKTAIQHLKQEMQKAPLMYASALMLMDRLKSEETEKEQLEIAYSAGSLNKTENILLGKTKVTAQEYFQHTYGQ